MYFQRHIDDYLEKWISEKDRLPLIVRGARQIGKTESIKHFAYNHYESVIEINLITDFPFRSIIADGYNVNDIIKNISRINPELKFIPGKTLLFFDEIQAFPDISTSLKFFKIDNRFDVICSGSLLGINYKAISSNSVGYKIDYNMYSMDFEEYLWAIGYKTSAIEEIYSHMVNMTPFNDNELNVWNNHFIDYCILGGMPSVVKNYVTKKTFENCLALQRQLLLDYKDDISKYAEGLNKTRILNVFNHIPVQLAKDNKKFQISKVSSGARFKDYWGCIEWLYNAGLINICYCLNFPELPLKGNYDESKYKIYFHDTGLLVASLDDEAQDDLRANKNLDVYKGALFESVVAEALIKSGAELFYYKREDSTLEEDFFCRTKSKLVPVEVKSTNGKAKSLSTLIKSKNYEDISWGIKLVKGNLGYENDIRTFPRFCAFLIKRYLREFE